MPIAALPKDTARVITSTLALNDAASVIKELIDNALDARADTVSVEIAANTLDVIQVKDNGSGIGVEDRQLLCKRGCTSKIRSIEDLASLGGTFLGFRGEALASVAELGSAVMITTRIEGEVVATALKFGPEGKLLSSSSASHPVGTTVRIQDFLSKIPVRKQTALKATTKTIATIRKLLQAYAFARPEVRLSFKVLKAKAEKANWALAPSKSLDSLSEVASKIAGKDVANQCTQEFILSEDREGSGSCWQICALVISPISEIRKACNSDQYFSVDRRPVNAERGVMKEMSKTYKRFLRNTTAAVEPTLALTKPFLLVRISCPPDTYDVNVEPAKDEVLFFNPALVRSLFDQLMEKIYGHQEQKPEPNSSHKTPVKTNVSATSSFDILLARKSDMTVSAQDQGDDQASQIVSGGCTGPCLADITSSGLDLSIQRNMSQDGGIGCVEQSRQVIIGDVRTPVNMDTMGEHDRFEKIDSTPTSEQVEEDGEHVDSADVRNPWSLAKLNVRLGPRNISGLYTADSSAPNSASPVRGSPGIPDRVPLRQRSKSPTPSDGGMVSFQNPGPPLRPWGPRLSRRGEDSTELLSKDTHHGPKAKSALDTWIDAQARPCAQLHPPQNQSIGHGQTLVHHSQPIRSRQHALISPIAPSPGRGRGASQQQRLSLPSKTPLKLRRPTHDMGLHSPQSNGSPARDDAVSTDHQQVAVRPQQALHSPPSSSQVELDEILEFERRKKIVAAQQRKQLAAKGNWSPSCAVPLWSSHSSTRNPDGAERDAAAFPKAFNRPTDPREPGEIPERFESRFANSDPAQEMHAQQPTPARSNPHHNRYIAATRNLSQPQREAQDQSHGYPEPQSPPTRGRQSSTDHDDSADTVPTIADSDPRAYFIRFRQQHVQQNQADANGLTRTSLKIRRAKTTRLPLESVPVDARVHDLAVELRTPQSIDTMRGSFAALSKVDEYIRSGTVKAVVWSPWSKEVSEWENVVKQLVRTKYRPRVLDRTNGDDISTTPSSLGGFEFEMNLSRVLKAFVDRDGYQ